MSHDSDISPLTRLVARLDRLSAGISASADDTGGFDVAVSVGDVDPAIVASGFPSIDRAIGGGFRRGDLVVLGGDDGVGCSALALAITLRADRRALLLTSEMRPERAYERALSMSARVSLEALRLGVVSTDERTRLATAALMLRDKAPVVETLLTGGVQAVDRALEASPDVPLVVVDALEGLLDRDLAPADALAHAVLTLKRLALHRQVVVLLTTHLPALDRQRGDRRPRLADFGLGGAVGAHADLVLGLYREELYEADLGVTGATELLVLKHRDGPRGYIDLYFDARFGRFEDVLEE
ncbi:DnaB-like helicase C-terminal domain-containing protein [Gemmatimonas aurantiaca]|uniref:DnaB-like helicase C-terminal domain-containing protein n=1 Tax=Gemmatimonas aurantiaca TaxID=173480 RepID=UPI00301C320C